MRPVHAMDVRRTADAKWSPPINVEMELSRMERSVTPTRTATAMMRPVSALTLWPDPEAMERAATAPASVPVAYVCLVLCSTLGADLSPVRGIAPCFALLMEDAPVSIAVRASWLPRRAVQRRSPLSSGTDRLTSA